jgi:glycosyltransferase involved in cell wall biosynthesis
MRFQSPWEKSAACAHQADLRQANQMSKTSSPYVLVVYPLSHQFREKVSHIVGSDMRSVFLAELRNLGIAGMLKYLRRMDRSSSIYIALEDKSSEALLPLLLVMIAFSSARKVYLIQPDGSVMEIGALRQASEIASAMFSSIVGFFTLLRCWCAVTWLHHRPQMPLVAPEDTKDILYINANLWFGVKAGGSVGHIAGVVNAFTDAGYKVDLVSANPQVMLRDGVRQTVLPAPRSFGSPYELNYFRYNYQTIKHIRHLLSRRRYRFLYQRMSVINYVGVALSRLFRIPLILEYNGSEIWAAKNWGRPLRFSKLGLAVENICLRHAHRVVVVSRVLQDQLVERGIDRDRIVCYPNCVDPAHYSPELVSPKTVAELRNRYEVATEAVLIAFVGTFGLWHGAPVLAAAIKQLVDREEEWMEENKVRFAMIGDGVRMKEVRELIGAPEYSKRVVFIGLVPQADTVKYLAAADILVSPHIRNSDGTRFFGSPTKLFEYMAMAKGIVASDLDQIGEVLSTGIRVWEDTGDRDYSNTSATAVLTRPGDVGDLINGLKLLVEWPGLRWQLGLNARAELLRRYTWSHHVAHILETLCAETSKEKAELAVAEPIR